MMEDIKLKEVGMPLLNKGVYKLVLRECEGNVSKFADAINMRQQTINRLFNTDSRSGNYPSVSQKIKDAIEQRFNVREIELLQLAEEDNNRIESNAKFIENNYIINVPLVNQYAQAGYLCGYNDKNYMETLPTIPFIVDHEAKGSYVAFEVKGDSMNNGTEESYLNGDRLLCREIAPHLWVNSKLHIRKWDFVIVHKEGILVKRIIDHDVEHHTITIHSINDMYEDRVLDLADVYQIFNVIEFLRPRRR